MSCDVDTDAEIRADVLMMGMPPFMLDPSPPPFQCRPGSDPAGYYDEATQMLLEYDGDGDDASLPNSHGRTDVEGCCFWGRGALLTRGSVSVAFFPVHSTISFIIFLPTLSPAHVGIYTRVLSQCNYGKVS